MRAAPRDGAARVHRDDRHGHRDDARVVRHRRRSRPAACSRLKPLMPQFVAHQSDRRTPRTSSARGRSSSCSSRSASSRSSAARCTCRSRRSLPDAVALSQTSQIGIPLHRQEVRDPHAASPPAARTSRSRRGDYIWQWWQYEQSLRMTKDEVKQEMKQNDGDPHIKQRRRAIARVVRAPPDDEGRRRRRTSSSSTRRTSPSRSSTTRPSLPRRSCSRSASARSPSASRRSRPKPACRSCENKPLARALLEDARKSERSSPTNSIWPWLKCWPSCSARAARAAAGKGARSHEHAVAPMPAADSRSRRGAEVGARVRACCSSSRCSMVPLPGDHARPVPRDEHRHVARRAARRAVHDRPARVQRASRRCCSCSRSSGSRSTSAARV